MSDLPARKIEGYASPPSALAALGTADRWWHQLSPRLKLGAGCGLLLIAVMLTVRSIAGNPNWSESTDFGQYATAAQAMMRGANPYDHAAVVDGIRMGYAYPPTLALVLAVPLSVFGGEITRWLWSGVTISVFAACLILLLRRFGPPVTWTSVVFILGIACNAFAIRVVVYHGQLDPLLALLFVVGLWALHTRRTKTAGLAFGVMMVGKPFLGIAALWLLWTGAFSTALMSIFIAGLLFVLSFAPTLGIGLGAFDGWVWASRYVTSVPYVAFLDNHALNGLFARGFSETQFGQPWLVSPMAWTIMSVVTLGGLLAVACATVPRWSKGRSLADEDGLVLLVEAGTVMGLVLSFGPLMEGNHLLFFLPAAVGSARLAWREWSEGRRTWMPAAVAWGVLILGNLSPVRAFAITNPELLPDHPVGLALLLTWRVGALVLIATLLSARALRQHRTLAAARRHAALHL